MMSFVYGSYNVSKLLAIVCKYTSCIYLQKLQDRKAAFEWMKVKDKHQKKWQEVAGYS